MSTKTEKTSGKVTFHTTGEGMTNLIRDTWVSDTPKQALAIAKSCGMDLEQSILVITGKKKLIGDTRENDGCLDWTDDNATEVSGISLSVEVMVERLEKKYIDISEALNSFNGVNTDEDDYDYSNAIENHKTRLSDVLEQLQEVYSITGKTMKDLPVKKIRSAKKIKDDYRAENPEEFKKILPSNRNRSFQSNFEEKFDHVMRNTQMGILNEMDKEKVEEVELSKEEKRSQPFYTSIAGGGSPFYIVHCPVEKCVEENLGSGWLLPDGTFFGGRGVWVHRGILDELSEYDFFKDRGHSSDEDDVQDRGNWIKVSAGDWMIWGHKHQPTKEQVEFIIPFTTDVRETTFIKVMQKRIHVQVFAEILTGREFDAYDMAKDSEGLPELEKNDDFPTIDEVSEIDPLCTPFFVPDAAFVKWLVAYANGRIIVDCGAGSGYLSALLTKHGAKLMAIEPHWSIERKMFWMKHNITFHIFPEQSETCEIALGLPPEKALFLFARPCHNGFVERTIKKLPAGSEILYISHKDNRIIDLPVGTKYTELEHAGTSKEKEFVLSIKK